MCGHWPSLADEHITEVARQRGLLAEGESLTEAIKRTSRALAAVDRRLEAASGALSDCAFGTALESAMLGGRLLPASQILASAGRGAGAASCTVLPTVGVGDESRLARAISEAEAASMLGMGVGIDLSTFQDPVAALVRINASVRATGTMLVTARRRPPALMVSCSSQHPKVEDFIRAKWDANFGEWVANISVRFEGDPDDWERLRPLLAEAAHRNGEPGVLFQAAADADNPTPGLALVSTAPCAEVFLAPGERCVFVSVNAAAHIATGGFAWDAFDESVALAVRAADAAVELASVEAPAVVAKRRRVGVGLVGFHSALIQMDVPYALSAGFARELAERLTFAAHRESTSLAARRGPFPLWAGSRWRDRSWLRRKAHRRLGAVAPREWTRLEESILSTGVRNAAVVAYPPTGVVATILGVSRSYEPHYSLVGRTGVASTAPLALVPEVAEALMRSGQYAGWGPRILDPAGGYQFSAAEPTHLLACARQLPPAVHLDVHEAFSGLADEAASKTVNLPAACSVGEIAGLLDRARDAGLKGLTVFREGCLTELSESYRSVK